MNHKDHIHAASLDGDYMYTLRENEPDVLYSLLFETEGEVDFIGTYAPHEIKRARPHDTYSLSTKVTFYYLLHKIVLQVNGKSDLSQGNYFNHPSLDLDDKEDNECEDNTPSFVVRKDIKVSDERTAETMLAKKLPYATGYNIYYSEMPCGDQEIIGEYIQCKWRPVGNKQIYNYELLDELLNQIESEIMQNKRPTTKEKREAEGLPGQDAYETGLMDGKKQTKKEKTPLYRISLKANNGLYQVQGLSPHGDFTEVINETNNPDADELIRKFVDSMEGIGFMESTIHQTVINLADEFASLK